MKLKPHGKRNTAIDKILQLSKRLKKARIKSGVKLAHCVLLTLTVPGIVAGEIVTKVGETDSSYNHFLSLDDDRGQVGLQQNATVVASGASLIKNRGANSREYVRVEVRSIAIDASSGDKATSPTTPSQHAIAATRFGTSIEVIEGLHLSHLAVPTDLDQILITGDRFNGNADVLGIGGLLKSTEVFNPVFSLSGPTIPPLTSSVTSEKPKIDSTLTGGKSQRVKDPGVVDFLIADSALDREAIYFDLSHAEDPGLRFRDGFGSVDMAFKPVSDGPTLKPTSLAFLGMSWRWFSILSTALFFALTTVGSMFLISRAGVIEYLDPRSYSPDGPRPTRLRHESLRKNSLSGWDWKARRRARKRVGDINVNLDHLASNDGPKTVEAAARQLVNSLTDAERQLLRQPEGHMLRSQIRLEIRHIWRLHNPNSLLCFDAEDNHKAYDPDAISGVIVKSAQELIGVESGADIMT